jgi:hypothetical protein
MVGANPRHIRHDAACVDAILRRCANVLCDRRNLDERLAGNATRPGAIAADAIFLQQSDASTEFNGEVSGDQSGCAGADDRQVILWFAHQAASAGACGAAPNRVSKIRLQTASSAVPRRSPSKRKSLPRAPASREPVMAPTLRSTE